MKRRRWYYFDDPKEEPQTYQESLARSEIWILEDELQKKQKQINFSIGLLAAIFIAVVVIEWRIPIGGLYKVYACKSDCYVLDADMHRCGGRLSGVYCADRLYYSNGESRDIDCIMGNPKECYDGSDDPEGGLWTDIYIIRREGERRSELN